MWIPRLRWPEPAGEFSFAPFCGAIFYAPAPHGLTEAAQYSKMLVLAGIKARRGFLGMSEQIRFLMNGAAGKMGRALSAGLSARGDMRVCAAVDTKQAEVDYGFLCGMGELGFGLETNLAAAIERTKPAVVIDFTNPAAVMRNIKCALSCHTPIVVGTTGIEAADFAQIAKWCEEYQTAAFVAANFALGAVLMMRFAVEAAKYMPQVEVIERHHDQKLDAPSGTAVSTLEQISAVRRPAVQGHSQEFERLPGSRGAEVDGMRVHSVRLPGYVATQEVVFGAAGQVLCIRHDAMSREAYVPGVALAVQKILTFAPGTLVRGLESLL